MDLISKATSAIYQKVIVVTNIKKGHESGLNSMPEAVKSFIDPSPGLLTYEGYLKAVDPLSASIILCSIDDRTKSISHNVLILSHVITDIIPRHGTSKIEASVVEEIVERERSSALAGHPYFHRTGVKQTVTDEELRCIQESITSLFQRYRVPIRLEKSNQELIIADSVRVKPPYNHESDYICPTRVILQRIKHMVDSRPR